MLGANLVILVQIYDELSTSRISYNSDSKWQNWPWRSRSMTPIFIPDDYGTGSHLPSIYQIATRTHLLIVHPITYVYSTLQWQWQQQKTLMMLSMTNRMVMTTTVMTILIIMMMMMMMCLRLFYGTYCLWRYEIWILITCGICRAYVCI